MTQLSIEKIIEEKKGIKDAITKYKNIRNSYINSNIERKEEYNGRQIFEMLQNIDDQKSKECLIELNTYEKSLTFYNKGEPFSTEGIISVMIPNISPKKGSQYIGNKGLGFRAVLNWSEDIEIYSDGKVFSFSQEIAEKYSGFNGTPPLMFPDITTKTIESDKRGWITYVKLKNISDDNIKEIKRELRNFNDKLLLFLHNLQNIIIKIDDKDFEYSATECKKIDNDNENIIERKIWNQEKEDDITYWIFNKNYPLQEKQCNIQIAVQPEGDIQEKDKKLFNFFPTQHTVNLPCILHATLELEASRNYIKINNQKNKEILTKVIPSAFDEFAKFIKKQSLKNNKNYWKAYKLLSAPKNSDNEQISIMYEKILTIRDNGEFCPCIDKTYRKSEKVKNYSSEINAYFGNNGWNDVFSEIVMQGIPKDFPQQLYESSYFIKNIENRVKESNLDDMEIVNLLYELYKIREIEKIQPGMDSTLGKYNILKDEKGNFIESGNALTPQSEDNMIVFPDYLQFRYLSKEFCDKFYEKFKKEIDLYKDRDASLPRRSFINNLNILNITFYDRSKLLPLIISQCEKLISEKETLQHNKNGIIRQMLESLYENRLDINDLSDEKSDKKIPIYINRDNTITYSTDLLFPQAKEIYEDKLPDDVYLKDFSTLKFLENESEDKKNIFLKKIGIQPWIRFAPETIKYNNDYIYFLQNINELPESSKNYNPLKENIIVKTLQDSEVIKKLNIETFQELLQKEPKFKEIILEEKSIDWRAKGYQHFCPQVIKYSYVAYQLRNYANNIILDFNNKTLEELGFKHIRHTDRYTDVFIKLGAKNTVADFSTEELYRMMKEVKERNIIPNQAFYKNIFETLKENTEDFSRYKNDLYLLAYTKNGKEFLKNSEIYYDDNKSLGKIYLNGNYPIFILPPKLGAEKVCNIFGTKRIDESKRKIKKKVLSSINNDFQKDFQTYLPDFLAIRINDKQMGYDHKVTMANNLKQIKIEIVEELISSFDKENDIHLEENNFCSKDGVYYIKTTIGNIQDLHNNTNFCQCISDILCIEMEASSEERDYKNCFYDRKLYKDILENDSDLKEEIQKLLGYSDNEIIFYKNIINKLNLKNKYSEFENNNEKIVDIKSDLNTEYGFNFNLNDADNTKYIKIKEFAKKNNIDASQLLDNTENIIDFNIVNERQFENTITRLLKDFKHKLWESLNQRRELQEYFIDIVRAFEDIIKMDNIKTICEENENFEYDYKTTVIETLKDGKWYDNKNEFKIDYDKLKQDEQWEEPKCFYDINVKDNEIIQQNNKLRSLLFFEGNEEKIQNALKIKEKEKEQEDDTQNLPLLTEADWILSENPKPKNIKINIHKKGESGRVNQLQMNKQGKKAELLVMDYLTKQGYAPEHISGNSNSVNRSDAYHYDIRYIDENNNEKLVEVKSTSNCAFYMSDDEFQFAIKKENKDKYILAIVKDNKVKFINNFAELIDDNKYFRKVTDSWKFYFEIEYNNEEY